MSRRYALFIVLPSSFAHAATPSPAGEALGGFVQLLPSLALVIAFIFGSLWLLKRLSMPRGATAGLLRVIAAQAVGPRERVVLVEVGGRWLVLGVAPGSVRSLADLPRQDLPLSPPSTPVGGDFASWLKAARTRNNAAKPSEADQ